MMETQLLQKGKRAKRQRPISTCSSLSSTVDGGGGDNGFCDLGLSCGGGGGGGGSPKSTIVDDVDEDMANCLILLAQGNRPTKSHKSSSSQQQQPLILLDSKATTIGVGGGDEFECKTCNRRFPSFQALGGHRASHKKGTTASAENFQLDIFTNTSLCLHQTATNKRPDDNNKSRVHECLICGAEFGSGQALGGHMRRHRPLPVAASKSSVNKHLVVPLPADQQVNKSSSSTSRLELLGLDLNLPAPEDDPSRETSSKFRFAAAKDQGPPLVGCHY